MTIVRVSVLADDLTGALDVLAPFAERGLATEVLLTPAASIAAVVGIDAAARDVDRAEAVARLGAAAECLADHGGDGLLFAKVDSTLRGHPDAVVDALLAASGRTIAIVCPAVPAQGRRVRGGEILTDDGRRLTLDALHRPGWTVVDAQTDHELDVLAAAIDEISERVVVVGAAGLGQALARRVPAPPARLAPPAPPAWRGPVLYIIGSQDPRAAEQGAALEAAGITRFDAPDGVVDVVAIAAALAHGSALLVSRNVSSASEAISRLADGVGAIVGEPGPPLAVLVTGGGTARAVLSACCAERAQVLGTPVAGVGEVVIAHRRVHRVFTKPGGFGTPTTLVDLQRLGSTPSASSGTGLPSSQ